MLMSFRFHGGPPVVPQFLEDGGFNITIAPHQTFQLHTTPLHQIPVVGGFGGGAGGAGNAAITNFIRADSVNRLLSQPEVLYLLRNVTIPPANQIEKNRNEGLFMYQIHLLSRQDGHHFHHARDEVALLDGDEEVIVKYRFSVANNNLVARCYHLREAPDKFLVHYLQGVNFVDDPNVVIIPPLPLLHQVQQ